MYSVKHKLLEKYSNSVLGIEQGRKRELLIGEFSGLTIVSGNSGGGKNTLLAGIALNYKPEDCCVVYTESLHSEETPLGKVAYSYLYHYKSFDVEDLLKSFDGTTCSNFFIEQYNHVNLDMVESITTLEKLRVWCKNNNKRIFICVHSSKVL